MAELRESQKTLFENFINDTRRKKPPSNKTRAIAKSANMGIWVVATTNQLFIRGS